MRSIVLSLVCLSSQYAFILCFTTRIDGRRAFSTGSRTAKGASTSNDPPRVVELVEEAGYGERLVRLSSHGNNNDPRIVEVFVDGKASLARLVKFVAKPSREPATSPPRVVIDLLLLPTGSSDNEDMTPRRQEQTTTIDLGQITTVWSKSESAQMNERLYHKAVELVDRYRSRADDPLDKLLDKVYARFVRRGRKTNNNNAKRTKKLPKDDPLATVLKKLQKTGPGYARLLDSSLLSQDLPTTADDSPLLGRLVAFLLIAVDAQQGGRFKRWPSLLVSRHPDGDDDECTLVNGGWLVVDQNVRAGTEARKLVERTTTPNTSAGSNKNSHSVAEERILQRLECLAMGQVFDPEEVKLEKDVRETLRTMDLPFTSDGASQALIRMGRWTPSTQNKFKQAVQPWSLEVLQAASWYAELDWHRWIEDTTRSDLRQLPAVCVDAKSTTFRDDAMSVRPRARTGRWLDENASKWEILIHITDVSDIHVASRAPVPDRHGYLPTLLQAAASRGISRYDLPLGPLHLLPPIVLQKLSFSQTLPHRCVSLWVYIDERDGKLLDAGVERSIVAPPAQISYSEASKLMDTKRADLSKDLERTRSILLLVERNLNCWKDRRVRESEAARKREGRLASRASNYPHHLTGHDSEDGSSGFRRTRGHRLVDTCLDMYSFAGRRLLRKAEAPIPMVAGAEVSKGGRLATAPLRRYVDGQSQRQLLAVLCSHGDPMTLVECREVGLLANKARNAIANVRAGR